MVKCDVIKHLDKTKNYLIVPAKEDFVEQTTLCNLS
jgi:hypothetical protein